jgi:hypothetical protein
MKKLGAKEQRIMSFLHERIFDPILSSPEASDKLKQGARFTIMRPDIRQALHYAAALTRDEVIPA